MTEDLLVWLFGLILGFAIVVFAMLYDEPEDEIFRDDVTEEPIVSPQHTCVECKKKFWIGEDKKAVMILPEKENYVNIDKNCLHLFYSKHNPLPEFSNGW